MSTQTTPEYDIGVYVSKASEIYTKDIVNWVLIGLVGMLALGVGSWGGYQNCALKALRGEKPEIGDVLMPFSRFGDFFLPALFIGLCIFPGVLLCGLGIVGARVELGLEAVGDLRAA